MIDSEARKKALEILQSFADGKQNLWNLEEDWPRSSDRLLQDLSDMMSLMFGETNCKIHSSSSACSSNSRFRLLAGIPVSRTLSDEARRRLNNALLFLQSDEEYLWPEYQFIETGWNYAKRFFQTSTEAEAEWKKYLSAGDFAYWPFIDCVQYGNARITLAKS